VWGSKNHLTKVTTDGLLSSNKMDQLVPSPDEVKYKNLEMQPIESRSEVSDNFI